MRVLVLNPGSSSLKSSVVEAEAVRAAASAPLAASPPLAQVDVDWGVDATTGTDPADDIRALLKRYEAAGVPTASLGAVGYRVVHGGERFREPTLVTLEVVAEVDALRALAPLHNGIAVATMRAGLAAIPQLPHVAVFDTAFHATLPEDAYRYPVPEEWYSGWGVRRYGLHGISVAWSAERAATLLDRPAAELRLVVAHLGSGCSVTAVDGGRSVATSMGLTPLEGLMMGTRAGSIDPGPCSTFSEPGAWTPTSWPSRWTTSRGSWEFPAEPRTCANCWLSKPQATRRPRSRWRSSSVAPPNASPPRPRPSRTCTRSSSRAA
jgi:acetate kinase